MKDETWYATGIFVFTGLLLGQFYFDFLVRMGSVAVFLGVVIFVHANDRVPELDKKFIEKFI